MAATPHRRQFIICPKEIKTAPGWKHLSVSDKHVLSYCPELSVINARDQEGTNWALLGTAVDSLPNRAPSQSIAECRTDQVPLISQNWAGRWLLISPTTIHTDASALLGCAYATTEDGSVWASSSVTLLSKQLGFTEKIDSRQLKYEQGLAWFPPPHTPFKAIKRLLPSQALCLDGDGVRPHSLMPQIQTERPTHDSLQSILLRLKTIMAGLSDHNKGPIWLGLTAGYDSRLMLAIAQQTNTEIQPFTRLTRRMSVADRVMPPTLSRLAGLSHQKMREAPQTHSRQQLLSQHAPNLVSDGDAAPFLSASRADIDGIIIGGHGFAVASGFSNWRDLPDIFPSPNEAANLFAAHLGEPPSSPALCGLHAWFDWASKTEQEHLDWRDRLFLEQRQAGWLAAKEQIYDMDNAIRFPVLNCAALYADILSINPAERLGSKLQQNLIARLSPTLNALPYNPKDRSFLLRYPHWVLRRRLYKLSVY